MSRFKDAFIRNEVLPRSPIGGGKGYVPDDPITRDDADVVARTAGELESALADRTGGVVLIARGAEINFAGITLQLRGDTTLAGELADDGTRLSTLYTNAKGADSHAWAGGPAIGAAHIYDDASIEQLRYIGPHIDHFDNPEFPGYIPFPPQDTYAERKKNVYSPNRARGIKVHTDGLVLDNVELAGWAQQGCYLGDRTSNPGTVRARRVDGHDCMMTSAGYIFDVGRGELILEDSYLNAARHVICGFGYKDCSYVMRNVLVGPSHSSHMFDMHRVGNNLPSAHDGDPEKADWKYRAGGRIELENVTTVATHIPPESEGVNFDAGNMTDAVSIRGVPYHHARAERCHFAHDEPHDAFAQSAVPDDMADEDGYCNFEWPDNRYGVNRHYPGYGADLNLQHPEAGEPLLSDAEREAYGAGVERMRKRLGI